MPTVPRFRQPRSLVFLAALFALLALAPATVARELYVPGYGSDTVSVVDTVTGQPIGAPILTGADSGPFSLTVSPDGKTVYTGNYEVDNIGVIGTQEKAQIAPPIPVGDGPIGIAISPDGARAYVANSNGGTVSVVDLITRQVVGAPIEVGGRPMNPVLTPDGKRLYVPNFGADYVSVIDTATNQPIGGPIKVGPEAYVAAITPNGQRLFVTSVADNAVYAIDTATNQVIGGPIPAGENASGVTISPDGSRAYVSSFGSETVDIVDTQALVRIGTIGGVGEAEFLVLTPDGRKGFATNSGASEVLAFDPLSFQLLAPAIPTGASPGFPGVVPSQPPMAALSGPAARVRPGVATGFSAAGSFDPDGVVANFAWSFGDGGTAAGAVPQATHIFAKPGTYNVTLTLTDNEGCSTSYIATSPTAFCNGSAVATKTLAVSVAYPGVRANCPKRAKPGGCKIKLQAVAWKGKGKKRRLRAQSAPARAKVKAGKFAIVSLKPRKAARGKLAKAKKILVRQTRTVDGEKRVTVRRLKVVR